MTGWFADTLAKRLFGLMCVALVGSHLIAFAVVRAVHLQPQGPERSSFENLPTFPSLPPTPGIAELRSSFPPRDARRPPGGPPADRAGGAKTPAGGGPAGRFDGGGKNGPAPRPPDDDRLPGRSAAADGTPPGGPALPVDALLLDYGVRFAVMAIASWFGSRWLARPMQRLVQASRSLGNVVSGALPAQVLDEGRGTREVRETARVFNEMAKELRQQFRSRGLMVAAISHDLRTPLTRLRMRLQNDGRMAADTRQRSVDDIREMSALIDGVLEVFRLDGAAGSDPAQQVDLDALVQSMVDDLTEQGQPVSYHGGPAVALAQPAALRRVVDNVVANALRYGERADLRLQASGGKALLTVEDAGPGIAPAELEAVFEPFYRVEASRNRHTGGSGLGLYIARELTRRQRGSLTLSNRPEGGLRAALMLPLHGPASRRGAPPTA